MLRTALILAILALAGCGTRLVSSAGGLTLEPEAVDFGATWVGHPAVQRVTVRSETRGARQATLTVTPPFVLSVTELEVPGGARVELEVTLTASSAASLEGAVSLTTDGQSTSLALKASAVLPPDCGTPSACHQVAFDPLLGACVTSTRPNGEACSGDACIDDGRCEAGICKGAAARCDDANACTLDSCGADGCIHAPLSCPAPSDPCQVPSCDPMLGCATEAAVDGTRCGSGDCLTAHVCISGRCEERAVPDGASCGEATPCSGAPSCQSGSCVPAVSGALAEQWSYTPPNATRTYAFGSQDLNGNLYFLELEGASPSYQFWLTSLALDGAVRFRVAVGGPNAMVTRGPIDVAHQQILLIDKSRTLEARSLVDGSLKWSVNYFDEMKTLIDRGPGATYNFSIYETVLVSNTIAVLNVHEDAGPWRSWAVGLNLLTGKMEWNREHPGHLSGFVSDGLGNVFYVEGANGLWLISLRSDGVFRWHKQLSTATWSSVLSLIDGALLFRGTNEWIDAANGASLGSLGNLNAGYVSVGDGTTAWLIEACSTGACSDSVRAYDVHTRAPRWTTSAGNGINELLLANKGTVLAITSPKGIYPAPPSTVVALDPTGARQFRCQTTAALELSPVLADGLLIGQQGTRVVAFSIPKIAPAPKGWITTRGNFLRTGRAR